MTVKGRACFVKIAPYFLHCLYQVFSPPDIKKAKFCSELYNLLCLPVKSLLLLFKWITKYIFTMTYDPVWPSVLKNFDIFDRLSKMKFSTKSLWLRTNSEIWNISQGLSNLPKICFLSLYKRDIKLIRLIWYGEL